MKFIDLARYKFILEPRYYFYGWSNSPKILARQSMAEALVKARSFLPKGHNFKIWDCKRSLETQALMLKSFRRRLRLMYPGLPMSKIKKLLFKFGGRILYPAPKHKPKKLKVDRHGSGGAVDLTIVYRFRKELIMGTDFDDLTEKAATDYFEKKKKLSAFEKEAKKNRRLLKQAMTKAGFQNYAAEWWHWGFGK